MVLNIEVHVFSLFFQILCLQEVTGEHYVNFFKPELAKLGTKWFLYMYDNKIQF